MPVSELLPSSSLFILAVLVGIAFIGIGVGFVDLGAGTDKPLQIGLAITFVLVGLVLAFGGYSKLRFLI